MSLNCLMRNLLLQHTAMAPVRTAHLYLHCTDSARVSLCRFRNDASGESYGGVYVPVLARALLRHNQRLHQQQPHASAAASSTGVQGQDPPAGYNLVGYVVGNGVTDDVYDGSGQVEFAFGLGLIDPQTYKAVKHTCKVSMAGVTLQCLWAAQGGLLCGSESACVEQPCGDTFE